MTAVRLLLTGLGLLLLAFLVLISVAWVVPSVFTVAGWTVLVLTLVGCGLVVCAALVSALTPGREVPAEPAIDHYA